MTAGRPRALTPEQEREVYGLWLDGRPFMSIARRFDVSKTTIRNIVRREQDRRMLYPELSNE